MYRSFYRREDDHHHEEARDHDQKPGYDGAPVAEGLGDDLNDSLDGEVYHINRSLSLTMMT